MAEDVIYCDANATTLMPQAAIDTMVKWCNRGNPSAAYASAKEGRLLMEKFRQYIADECDFDQEGPDGYSVLFTSGASESNCHIITAAVRSYAFRTHFLPHVITSAAEHKTVLSCCARLARERLCQLSVVPVSKADTARAGLGMVDPQEVRRAIRKNTCLITIMAANNETGALNNLHAIGEIAHLHRVPFHSDAVQLFSKSTFRPRGLNIDAFSASFHKLHGPPGVGLLCIKNKLVEGYDLCPLICGAQNAGLRGGTENLPGLAASFVALRHTQKDRGSKNGQLRKHTDAFIRTLQAKSSPTGALIYVTLGEYLQARPRTSKGRRYEPEAKADVERAQRLTQAERSSQPIVVLLGPADRGKVLPNTILLSVVRHDPYDSPTHESSWFCNEAARAFFERRGIIVGLGSACNTATTQKGTASHVLEAIGAPEELHSGALRFSLADGTTDGELARLVKVFLQAIVSDKVMVRQ
jgi:cysteine desulfurase